MFSKPNNRKNRSEKYVVYCTQCGEELENFCFSPDADDIKSIEKRHANCKKTGKFKGEICSRLYIAGPCDSDLSPN
jgi:hypothetical protein